MRAPDGERSEVVRKSSIFVITRIFDSRTTEGTQSSGRGLPPATCQFKFFFEVLEICEPIRNLRFLRTAANARTAAKVLRAKRARQRTRSPRSEASRTVFRYPRVEQPGAFLHYITTPSSIFNRALPSATGATRRRQTAAQTTSRRTTRPANRRFSDSSRTGTVRSQPTAGGRIPQLAGIFLYQCSIVSSVWELHAEGADRRV